MKNEHLETISIKELGTKIRLSDRRSIYRWCSLNNVSIIKNPGSRVSYVMRSEYEVAHTREFIKSLKVRYGKNWLTAYQAHVHFNIELLSAMQGTNGKNKSGKSAQPITNTGTHERRFLDSLTSLK